MTPSCISAHMTYMNIDYKYFSGSKDPINIINKYRMRGFGTWLNKNEIGTYIKYCNEISFWKNIFSIDPLKRNTYKNCLGSLSISNKLFKPRKYCAAFITNEKIKPIPEINPYNLNKHSHNGSEEEYYKRHYGIKKIKYDYCIDISSGYINPLNNNYIKQTINNIFKKLNKTSKDIKPVVDDSEVEEYDSD